MRILFLTENFPPETNAAASRVYERACHWLRWGHQVTVVTTAPNFPAGKLHPGWDNDWYRRQQVDGIDVVRVKSFISRNQGFLLRTLDFMSFMTTGFAAGLIQDDPDVVVATSPQFFAAVAGYALAVARRRPFVFELCDLWPASIRAVGAMRREWVLDQIEKLELFLYRQSAAVVALTPAFKRNLVARGIAPDKIAVVINGVDRSRYRPQPRDEALAATWGLSGRFVLGYIGTHGMAHALGNVLDAAALTRDRADIRFMLVGDGAEREMLVARARERGLDNVVLVPPQPKSAMPSFWSLCDAALVHLKNDPVFAEVIPSKIFEAMAMGLPIVVAAPAGEASRIVTGEAAGVHVPGEDPAALADAARQLADDRARLRDLARASLDAAARYSRERQAREMVRVFERVVAGQPVADLDQ